MKAKQSARKGLFLAFLLGAGLLPACNGGGSRSTPTSMGESRNVPIGVWGGPGVAVTITTSGAEIEFDCAHGTIAQPILLDAAGRFSAPGSYVQEHGGPMAPGPGDVHPALYGGTVAGDTMSFTVTLTDKGQTVGAFTAVNAASPHIVKCL